MVSTLFKHFIDNWENHCLPNGWNVESNEITNQFWCFDVFWAVAPLCALYDHNLEKVSLDSGQTQKHTKIHIQKTQEHRLKKQKHGENTHTHNTNQPPCHIVCSSPCPSWWPPALPHSCPVLRCFCPPPAWGGRLPGWIFRRTSQLMEVTLSAQAALILDDFFSLSRSPY